MRQLIIDLELKLGKPLNSLANCKELSADILNVTNENLSSQTIRRLAGLVKATTTPTLYTMDLLARYLGYDSYNSYVMSSPLKMQIKSQSSLRFIEMIYATPLSDFKGNNLHFLFRTLSKTIFEDSKIIEQFNSEILKSKSFREFFIERFPPIDLINVGGYNLFKKIKSIYKNSKSFNLYIDSLIYLYSNDKREKEKIIAYYQNFSFSIPRGLHPFLIGRYFGLKIILAGESKKILEIHSNAKLNIESLEDYGFQFCACFTYIEFLINKNEYQLALEVIQEFIVLEKKIIYWMEFGYKEVMKIFQFVCLVKMGKIKESIDLKKFIDCDTIPFYFRETYRKIYTNANKTLLQKINSN